MTVTNGNGNGNGAARAIQVVGIVVTVVTSVFAAFGTLAYFAIQSQIASLHELVESQRLDDQKRVDRLSDALSGLRADAITKSDHEALIERLTRVEQSVGSTYPLGEVLKDVQSRLQRVEERGNALRVPP